MKISHYLLPAASAALLVGALSACEPMLDTSLSLSPAPGVNIGVGMSTPLPIAPPPAYSPFWGSGIAGVPAWGLGTPLPPPARPVQPPRPVQPQPPVNRPVTLPGNTVVPPANSFHPYPTGPGPVVGGSGLTQLRPGSAGNGRGGAGAATPPPGGGSFRRPYERQQ